MSDDEQASLEPRAKPNGGFVRVKVWLLVAVWWCYHTKRLRLRGVRVFLALLEMEARRCTVERDREPHFGLEELRRLVGGVGGGHLRSDLRALEKLGLVRPRKGGFSWPKSVEDLDLPLGEFMEWFAEHFSNRARTVPLPRRLVRLLAGAGTRVLIATVLGHAIRMLYMRCNLIDPRGRCKLSWVATAFNVDISGAERARSHMVELGLIVRDSDNSAKERWFRRRWGGCFHWNLVWAGPVSDDHQGVGKRKQETEVVASVDTGLRGESQISTTDLRGVESDKHPLTGCKNQQPTSGRPAGVSTKNQKVGAPRLQHVEQEDLDDIARLLKLHELAAKAGLVGESEADELRFVALAEHARAYGTRNRGGLFAKLLGVWGGGAKWHITQDDEDRAQERIRSHRDGVATRRRPQAPKVDIHGEEIVETPADFRDVPRDEWVKKLVERSLEQAGEAVR